MPAVPNVPGVPALTSYLSSVPTLLIADLISTISFQAPRWGIFLNGVPALPMIQSIATFEYKQDWSIADYPVEDGAFQSYDKVQLPFDVRVRVASGSSAAERQALLDAVDVIANSLDLYDVVTPEKIYRSVNISHYDFRRTAQNGVGMIVIDLWFQEIRVTSTAAFSNTQQPANAGQQSNGNVQAQSLPASFQSRFGFGADGKPQVQ